MLARPFAQLSPTMETKNPNNDPPKTRQMRMTAKAFDIIKTDFPEEFANMAKIDVPVNRFELFRSRKKKQTRKDRYGSKIAEILDWLDENCSEPYYVRFQGGSYRQRPTNKDVITEFYFMNDGDAVAFKLMFDE